MKTINRNGNVDDIRASLKLGQKSKDDLLAAIEDERAGLKRSTVINMLNRELVKLSKKK